MTEVATDAPNDFRYGRIGVKPIRNSPIVLSLLSLLACGYWEDFTPTHNEENELLTRVTQSDPRKFG